MSTQNQTIHQATRLIPWKQSVIGLFQKLVVDYRFPGLSHIIRFAKPILFGEGLKTVSYRNRFIAVCDPCSDYNVMRTCGYTHRAHDRVLSWLVRRFSNGEIVFIDIGANEGFVSLLACSSAADGQHVSAHCFEPNPKAYEILKRNAQYNQFSMTLNNFAIGSANGIGILTMGKQSSNSSLVKGGVPYVENEGQVEVVIDTLDNYCGMRSIQPMLIKIDVEGFEPSVLEGANHILFEFRPYLVIEINPRALAVGGNSAADLLDLLHGLGYRLFHLDPARAGLDKQVLLKRPKWEGFLEVISDDLNSGAFFDALAIPKESLKIEN